MYNIFKDVKWYKTTKTLHKTSTKRKKITTKKHKKLAQGKTSSKTHHHKLHSGSLGSCSYKVWGGLLSGKCVVLVFTPAPVWWYMSWRQHAALSWCSVLCLQAVSQTPVFTEPETETGQHHFLDKCMITFIAWKYSDPVTPIWFSLRETDVYLSLAGSDWDH